MDYPDTEETPASIPALQFSAEETQEHLDALVELAPILENLLDAGDRSLEVIEAVTRVANHFGVMCYMDHIKNSGTDISMYVDLHRRAAHWLSEG